MSNPTQYVPKKRTIDERGLTSEERKLGATVQMPRALYRVARLEMREALE
jgi:hypothetical protein